MMCSDSSIASKLLSDGLDSASQSDSSLKLEAVKSESESCDEKKDEAKSPEKEKSDDATTPDKENSDDTKSQDKESSDETQPPDKPSVPSFAGKKTVVEVLQYVDDRTKALQELETYDNPVALANLKALGRVYWDKRNFRKVAGDHLSENGFAEWVIKALRYFNNVGIFKSDDVWFPAYYTLNDIWNFTDASRKLCLKLVDTDLLPLLVANLTHKPYLSNQKSKNVTYVLKSSLSIMQNISRNPELKHVFHANNAIEAVKNFVDSENVFFKLVSMMVLTALINEDENAQLDDTGVVGYMIQCLKKALDNDRRRHRGFQPAELVECLSRMAANDTNKNKIIDAGALPLLLSMVNYEKSVDDQIIASQAIWNLSFGDYSRDQILLEPGCLDALRANVNHENADLRKASKGALWVLEDGAKAGVEKQAAEPGGEAREHIMISYNWAHQDIIIQLKDRLKNEGHIVWIDVEQMGGSTLEAMAEAIEKAALVLICMSEKYKLSPNCRTEAEYTFQLRKPIIPLMMQRRYKPDGWLGMMVGAKLYINFDGKHDFETAYQLLMKEMKGQRNQSNPLDKVDSAPAFSAAPPRALKHHSESHVEVKKWDKTKVASWLDEKELSSLKDQLPDYTGAMLVCLHRMKIGAPEFFYRTLENRLGLDQMLRLTGAMDDLFE